MRLHFLRVGVMIGTVAAGPAWACHIDPKSAWNLTGFENPESAYFDGATNTIYVSNVAGDPTKKDGRGFISTLSPDGKIKELHWMDGMNAPKGIRVAAGKLYVTDIDRFLIIDISKKKIQKRVSIPGSKFLNDIAVDPQGTVYITDTMGDTVYSYTPAKGVKKFLTGPSTEGPNGIMVEGNMVFLASWGKNTKPDFSADAPGRLLAVDAKTKLVQAVTTAPFGNLDGIERDNHGDWIVSDWVAGKIFHITVRGEVRELVAAKPGSADIGFVPATSLVIVPQMKDNTVVAYYLK